MTEGIRILPPKDERRKVEAEVVRVGNNLFEMKLFRLEAWKGVPAGRLEVTYTYQTPEGVIDPVAYGRTLAELEGFIVTAVRKIVI